MEKAQIAGIDESKSRESIDSDHVFIVMTVEKTAFNGMGDIQPHDIKLAPVSGLENEAAVFRWFSENKKHLKVIGVQSLAYLRFQEKIMMDHLEENELVLRG